ncbi:recombinase family protein [Actinopolymorpha sp. B11F2]|uniref:recombinase family protein n=1 Tax=Actinopolymorpha sp. B11F2 TaxID=3160862 RepID=UPI0032E3A703
MRVIVYTRISRDDTGAGLGVARQREDCETLAAARGWRTVDTIVDNDMSAAGKRQRPGFERLMAAVEAGQVDAVVAWSFDRLTRNARDRLRMVEAGKSRGLIVALVRGSDLDMSTPAGRLTAGVLGEVAQHEIDQKADRQRRAARQAASQGRRTGGRRVFGYDADMTPRQVEADAVRDGYEALLAGASLGAIARDWRGRGLTTPQTRRGAYAGEPGRWTPQVVSRTLRKPAYAGLRPFDGDLIAAAWPSLVTEDVWRAAQAVLTDPGRRTGGGGQRFLLTGIALCGVDGCGLTVHCGGGYASRRNYRTYRCRSMGHVARKADPIDEFVGAVVVARMSRRDAADLLVDHDRPDVDRMRGEADNLRRRIDALAVDLEIDERTLARRDRALRERLAVVEAELADAGRVDVLGALVGVDDVAAAWDGLDLDRRRAVVDLLLTVRLLPVGRGVRTFRPESVGIAWR